MVESLSMSNGASERVVPRQRAAVVRNISSAVSLAGLAGLMVAATLGVAAAGGAPGPVDEPGGLLEVASQDVAVAAAPEQLDRALPVETPPRSPTVASGGVGVSAEAHHGDDGTVIDASSTVPNAKARVTAGEDEDRDAFVVRQDIEIATGTELGPVESHGDALFITCGGTIGDVLCDSDDGAGGD